jgi:hypothetical protein
VIVLSEIEAILRAEDIEGLLAAGAPRDEYDSEAKDICNALNSAQNSDLDVDQITDLIAAIWGKWFGLSTENLQKRKPAFRNVTAQIINCR